MMSTTASKKKKRPIPPLRSVIQTQEIPHKSDRTAGKAGTIQNDLDKAKPARYPNYLPELKARRAKATESSVMKQEIELFQLTPNSLDFNYRKVILENLKRLSDRPGKFSTNKVTNEVGHPLILPSPSTVRRLPKEIISLYRAPDNTIDEWDLDSPLLTVDLMRKGLAVGPGLSKLPSPASSQAVLFDIKGHRRKNYTKKQ